MPSNQLGKADPVEEIREMNLQTPSEAASSSSEDWLETVRDVTKLAAKIIDTISEKLSKSNAVKAMGGLTLKKSKDFRLLSATTAATQLEETNQRPTGGMDSVGLSMTFRISNQSTMPPGNKEVFLCHSGKQKNFVRQLHRDLTREHVSCFFDEDDNSLPLAHKFPPRIFDAAETCKIAVVVLSKEFIRSKWPMLELSAFISAKNSGKNANLKLLPIFFMITPKELSNITTDSRQWKKLEKNDGTRGEWQDALKEVRSIKGLSFAKDGNEVHLRDEVVKEVCRDLELMNLEFSIQREAPQNQSQSEASFNFSMDLQIQNQLARRQEQSPLQPGSTSDLAVSTMYAKPTSLVVLDKSRRELTFEKLLRCSAEVLGVDELGSLYRVVEDDGRVETGLVVKRLKDVRIPKEEFEKRMVEMAKMKHANVLPLVAYYSSKEEKLLIYDYMKNDSISTLLHGHLKDKKMDWQTRLGVASGVAHGLVYLHDQFPNTPQGNIKSSNVVLNSKYQPCITQCGLSFLLDKPARDGYKAPEYSETERLTQKSDVYSFGILLLELLTGKSVKSSGLGLPRWVLSVVREEWTYEVLDQSIVIDGSDGSEKRMVALLQIALDCVSDAPAERERPAMVQVAKLIDELKDEEDRFNELLEMQ